MADAWKEWQNQIVDGRFPLRQYLGGSDHSAVFLTKRGEGEAQKAAIKLIPAAPETSDIQLSRWQAAAKLSHPHLLQLFEAGRWQLRDMTFLYVVMEYAEESLSEIVPERALTPAEAGHMLPPVLEALAYLHGKGLVHGCITPANILAVGDEVKISSDRICASGETSSMGKTPDCAPPELSSGAALPASDVWALGATLVDIMTQHPPACEGSGPEPLVPEALPQPFLDIARHCLQRDWSRRWTVAEVKTRLQGNQSAAPEPTAAKPEPVLAGRRYRMPLIAVALLLLVVFVVSNLRKRPPQQAAPAVQPTEGMAPTAGNQAHGPAASSPAPRAEPTVNTRSSSHGAVASQVVPEVPRGPRNTIQGTVRVSVRVVVDASGKVTGAEFKSRGPSAYFANLALQAARRWKFTPPQVDGKDVASAWILHFEFRRSGTTAHSTPAP